MARKKPNMLGVSLLALSLATVSMGAVGQAHARYPDVIVQNTIVQGTPGTLHSNLLRTDTNQIILLGALESGSSMEVEFTLVSDIARSEEILVQCDATKPFTAELSLPVVEEGNLLQLTEGEAVTVVVTVTADEGITEPVDGEFHVVCGGLTGIFRVQLLPGETGDIPDEGDSASGAETEPTEPLPSETVGTMDEPTEDPTEDPTEEPTEDPTEATTEPTEPTAASEPVSAIDVEEPAALPLQIHTLSRFEQDRSLPVAVELAPDNGNRVVLGMYQDAFPAFTRYSLDGGESWYLMYHGGFLETTVPAGSESFLWKLLIDLTAVESELEEKITLVAQAYLDDALMTSASAELEAAKQSGNRETVWVLTKPEAQQSDELPEGEQAEEEIQAAVENPEDAAASEPAESTESSEPAESTAASEPTASAETDAIEPSVPQSSSTVFILDLPAGWESCTVVPTLQRLATGENGTSYENVDLQKDGICLELDLEAMRLTVRLDQNLPLAGTYRLMVTSTYQGICFDRMEATIFINYSTSSDAQREEVSDHD